MEPDFGRQWMYEMRNDGEVVDARMLGDRSDAMEWASSRLRDLAVNEALIVLVRDDGIEVPVGRVHQMTGD